MKNNNLTVTLHIGDMQIDKLTPQQTEAMANKVTEAMGAYYAENPDEFSKISNYNKEKQK